MHEPLRLAVVGVGRMGAIHARSLAACDTIDVTAVVDAVPEVADVVAHDIGAQSYSSPAALLERDDVEAWLIATPTATHPAVVTTAIEAGLHVLCEKPLALDANESEAIGALAREAGRVIQLGFWRRFSPPWAAAKSLIDKGAIGRPLMLRLAQWDADPPPAAFCDPLVSGGLAIDCGVHEFDLVEWLTGLPVESVDAWNLPLVDAAVGESGDVDNLVAVLGLAGGAVATVDLTRNCRYADDVRTEILGELGAIFVDLLPVGRTRLATSAGIGIVPGSETEDAFIDGIVAQAEAFATAVRGGMVGGPGALASTRAVRLGRAVQEAASTGVSVPFGR